MIKKYMIISLKKKKDEEIIQLLFSYISVTTYWKEAEYLSILKIMIFFIFFVYYLFN